MIKNIVNWTAGSMFRTIGRVIAYLIIGIIVTLLLTKFGVIDVILIGSLYKVFSRDVVGG